SNEAGIPESALWRLKMMAVVPVFEMSEHVEPPRRRRPCGRQRARDDVDRRGGSALELPAGDDTARRGAKEIPTQHGSKTSRFPQEMGVRSQVVCTHNSDRW